jgi:hypothetical protein
VALSRYVLTATVTVAAGTPATPVAGEPGTGGAAGYGNAATSAGYGVFPQTFVKGTAITLDPAGTLYAAIGAGNLRAYVPGQDDVSHAATSN